MRLLIDGMAVAGFAMSMSLLAGAGILYSQFDAIKGRAVKGITDQAVEAVTGKLTKELDGKFDGMVESLPKKTGPAMPF